MLNKKMRNNYNSKDSKIKGLFKTNRGQALVEFAIILPLLLLLIFGVIEFGRIFGAELTVNNSAREGARLGAIGATDSLIVTRVLNSAGILDSAKVAVTITPVEGSRVRGGEIEVYVSYPVTVFAPFISAITGETVTVDSSCVMRVE